MSIKQDHTDSTDFNQNARGTTICAEKTVQSDNQQTKEGRNAGMQESMEAGREAGGDREQKERKTLLQA